MSTAAPIIQRHHHITLCVGDAQEDYDFHTKLLSLKSVKKTALYDGTVPIYHLYYGNDHGDESTLVTSFPMRQSGRKGRPGTGQIGTLALAVPVAGLDFRHQRLAAHGFAPSISERFGERVLGFAHPCGITYELIGTADDARLMALSYVAPSLDTTIFAIGSAIWLFANYPDQWQLLRDDPSLIPTAINEILRMESPIQGFSRYSVADHEFDGVTLPADSRIIVLYGSANRDERRWTSPETFDIRRGGVARHLAFGYGEHACIGLNLAKLEMAALFSALGATVGRFECVSSERVLNNTLRGFRHHDVRVH